MTPLERAARALAVENGHDPDKQISHVSPPAPIWTLFVDSARTVLAAIREPDEAMTEAGGEQVLDTEVGAGQYASIADGRGSKLMANNQAVNAWTAMIDAILAGGE
jgi:hypothetical protein